MRFRGPLIGLTPGIRAGGSSAPDGSPVNLTATVDSDTAITLNWTIGSTNHDGHRIYISTDGVTFTEKGTVTGATATYNAEGLTQGTQYYFYVTAYNGSGESTASDTVNAYTITWFTTGEVNNVMVLGDSFSVGIAADVEATEGFVPLLMTYIKSKLGDGGDGMRFGNYSDALIYSNNFYQWTTDFISGQNGAGLYSACLSGLNTKTASITANGKVFDLIHYGNTSYNIKFTLTVDGVSQQITYAPAASDVVYKERITCSTNGDHTIEISGGADMICLLGGILSYNGNEGINLVWAAQSGATTLTYAPLASPDALTNQINTYQPKLTIIELGYNDYVGQVALNDYESRITSFVNTAKVYGKVILVNMMHYADGLAIPIEDYNTRLADVATATGAVVVDMYTVMGTIDNIVNNGWSTGSSYGHPTTSGHRKIVEELYQELIGESITWIHGQDSLPDVAFEAETTNLLSTIASQPSVPRQRLINKTIADLKAAGLWTKSDLIYCLCGHTEQATLLNWKENAHHLLKRNSPIFDTDNSWYGDAVSGYLETDWNFTADGVNWTLNSAGITLYQYGKYTVGGAYSGPSSTMNVMIRPKDGQAAINGWPNLTSGHIPVRQKIYTWCRTDANTIKTYANGVLVVTDGSLASVAVPNDAMDIFRYSGAGYNNTRYSWLIFHSALTDDEAEDLFDIIKYYMDNR